MSDRAGALEAMDATPHACQVAGAPLLSPLSAMAAPKLPRDRVASGPGAPALGGLRCRQVRPAFAPTVQDLTGASAV